MDVWTTFIWTFQEFREKNSDLMRHDIMLVLKNSSLAFVRELVGKRAIIISRRGTEELGGGGDERNQEPFGWGTVKKVRLLRGGGGIEINLSVVVKKKLRYYHKWDHFGLNFIFLQTNKAIILLQSFNQHWYNIYKFKCISCSSYK